MFEKLRDNLLDTLQNHCKPNYFNTARTEFRIRCPYCGDSQKSNRSAHLYIEIVNPMGFPFYCQRCNTSGVIGPDFLKDLNITDFNLSAQLLKFNKGKNYNNKRNTNITSGLGKVLTPKKLNLPKYQEKDKAKLSYLNTRFNINRPADEWVDKYYVIFNFYDFLKENEIKDIFIYDVEFLKEVIKSYVGFLSHDQSHIVFRNIDTTSSRRYFNYNIFNNPDGKKFYIPQGQLNIMSEKINLIITEGIFDIIGVMEKLQLTDSNTIFVSANGKGYNYIINYFARMGFTDMKISIYSDKDVSIGFYKNLIKYNTVARNNDLYIYYNKLSKDFGLPADQIDVSYSKL